MTSFSLCDSFLKKSPAKFSSIVMPYKVVNGIGEKLVNPLYKETCKDNKLMWQFHCNDIENMKENDLNVQNLSGKVPVANQ